MPTPYQFTPLPTQKSIRLVQIVPRNPSDGPDSLLELRSRIVELSSSRLRRGESRTPPSRPSISFDSYITPQLHPERFHILEDKGLRQKLKDRFKKDATPRLVGGLDLDSPPPDLVLGGPAVKGISADLSQVLIADGLLDRSIGASTDSDLSQVKGRPVRSMTAAPAGEVPFRDRYSWGSEHGPISGNYVALSYRRGSPTDTEKIHIDGFAQTLPANLTAALRRFRELEIFRMGLWIWIDALCVNQADPDEFKIHLELLPNIFRQAGNVIVWLGEPAQSDPVGRAMGYVQEISRHYRTEYLWAFDHDLVVSPGHRPRAKLQLYATKKLWQEEQTTFMASHIDETLKMAASIFTLYGNSYWRRTWVIQELTAGNHAMPVFCGEHMTQWRYIRDAAELLEPFEGFLSQLLQRVLAQHNVQLDGRFAIRHITDINRLSTYLYDVHMGTPESVDSVADPNHNAHLSGTPPGLPVVRQSLLLASDTECSNAKDRVLSLLSIPGMVTMSADLEMPASKIYTAFSERCLTEDNSLSILSLLDGRRPSDGVLPSWCPNFARPDVARMQPLGGEWCANGIEDGGVLMPWGATYFEPEAGVPVFRAMAWDIDSIDGLGAVAPADVVNLKLGKGVDVGVVQPTGRKRVHRGEAAQALWRIMTASTQTPNANDLQDILFALLDEPPHETNPDYARWSFFESSRTLIVNSNPLSTLLCPSPNPYRVSPTAVQARAMSDARCKNRRLAVTERGRLALVPAATQKGDMVAVLVSHGTPVILRPKRREGPDLWCEFVGEAFVDEVMGGALGRAMLKKEKWYLSLVYLHVV